MPADGAEWVPPLKLLQSLMLGVRSQQDCLASLQEGHLLVFTHPDRLGTEPRQAFETLVRQSDRESCACARYLLWFEQVFTSEARCLAKHKRITRPEAAESKQVDAA